jgi:lysophospholipase L1-like esterase
MPSQIRAKTLALSLALLLTAARAQDDPILTAWRHNLAQAKSHPVNVVVLGDSIACCVGPTNYDDIWTNILRQSLALAHGDHGSGIIPVGKDAGLATNPPWSLHPRSGTIDTVHFGPYQSGTGAFGGGFRIHGDPAITLYYASAPDSAAGIRVTRDDGSTVTIAAQTTPTLQAQTIPIPPNPTSTLTFSPASPTSNAYLYGIEFTYGSHGVTLHNLAHGYARTEAWGGDPDAQLPFLSHIKGGIQLAILSLGVNDSINHTGTTIAEYRAHMIAIVQHLRALDPKIPIVLYDEIPTTGGTTATLLPQSLIRTTEQQLAKELNLGYVSPLAEFGTASEALDRGYLAHDNVHPTDLGDRRIARVIDQYLEHATQDRLP